MTNIVVLIKQVPDTWSERKLTDGDYTLDREAADAVLDEINERAVEDGEVAGEREPDDGGFTLDAARPAVASVTGKINEPRFPSFKGIMAAKKKEVTTLTLAEIGVEPDEVGLANAGSSVLSSTPK